MISFKRKVLWLSLLVILINLLIKVCAAGSKQKCDLTDPTIPSDVPTQYTNFDNTNSDDDSDDEDIENAILVIDKRIKLARAAQVTLISLCSGTFMVMLVYNCVQIKIINGLVNEIEALSKLEDTESVAVTAEVTTGKTLGISGLILRHKDLIAFSVIFLMVSVSLVSFTAYVFADRKPTIVVVEKRIETLEEPELEFIQKPTPIKSAYSRSKPKVKSQPKISSKSASEPVQRTKASVESAHANIVLTAHDEKDQPDLVLTDCSLENIKQIFDVDGAEELEEVVSSESNADIIVNDEDVVESEDGVIASELDLESNELLISTGSNLAVDVDYDKESTSNEVVDNEDDSDATTFISEDACDEVNDLGLIEEENSSEYSDHMEGSESDVPSSLSSESSTLETDAKNVSELSKENVTTANLLYDALNMSKFPFKLYDDGMTCKFKASESGDIEQSDKTDSKTISSSVQGHEIYSETGQSDHIDSLTILDHLPLPSPKSCESFIETLNQIDIDEIMDNICEHFEPYDSKEPQQQFHLDNYDADAEEDEAEEEEKEDFRMERKETDKPILRALFAPTRPVTKFKDEEDMMSMYEDESDLSEEEEEEETASDHEETKKQPSIVNLLAKNSSKMFIPESLFRRLWCTNTSTTPTTPLSSRPEITSSSSSTFSETSSSQSEPLIVSQKSFHQFHDEMRAAVANGQYLNYPRATDISLQKYGGIRNFDRLVLQIPA